MIKLRPNYNDIKPIIGFNWDIFNGSRCIFKPDVEIDFSGAYIKLIIQFCMDCGDARIILSESEHLKIYYDRDIINPIINSLLIKNGYEPWINEHH